MMRLFVILATFLCLFFFPWQVSAMFALIASPFIPLLPLAAGLLADTLYYTARTEMLPLFSLYGALATFIAFVVRNRFNASIIKE